MQHNALMDDLKPLILDVIDGECRRLCHEKNFVLRRSSPEDLKNFSLDALGKDLERMAPFMFAIFSTITRQKLSHACAATAIALRGRENRLSAFSYYVNSVLQYGGAKKAAFERLCKMGITTCHSKAVLKQHEMAKLCGEALYQLKVEAEMYLTQKGSTGEPTGGGLASAQVSTSPASTGAPTVPVQVDSPVPGVAAGTASTGVATGQVSTEELASFSSCQLSV